MNKLEIINHLISVYQYETYLEIGVDTGATFKSVCVAEGEKTGIDPMGGEGGLPIQSDEFFNANDRLYDLIFIDGLHLEDQVYRDISASLEILSPNGSIVCHDVSPTSFEEQVVPRQQTVWTGDCWKAWVRLRMEREDLDMHVVDTDFGCGIIRKGSQSLLPAVELLDYNTFDVRRDYWLNRISVSEFRTRHAARARDLEIVCASHDETILRKNLMNSHFATRHPLTIIRGASNVASAYNSVKLTGSLKLMMWVHHDVYLPLSFEQELWESLAYLDRIDPDWGVAGVAGVRSNGYSVEYVGNLMSSGSQWGATLPRRAVEVTTLDELLLVTKGSAAFDDALGNHFYGADMCIRERVAGRKCYVVEAYCHHNSFHASTANTCEFQRSKDFFKAKHYDRLPLFTTCAIIE